MSKKKNTFGKLIAFTTAAAAIGGTCYIFRDKIKEHPLYEKSKDKLTDLYCKIVDRGSDDFDDGTFFDDDEFYDDDDFEDVFSAKEQGREYTSIVINPKNDSEEETNDASEKKDTSTNQKDSANDGADEDTIPIIPFDTARADASSETTEYENEGLSDVSEDPDTLAEQDLLDF